MTISNKNNRYSFQKSFLLNNDSINPIQKTCIISQPKKYVERYSLEKDSNIIGSNSSYIVIENNLIKEINKMKNKINQKQKRKKKILNSCTNLCIIDIKDATKTNGHLTLCPVISKDKTIKKNKSFELNDNSLKNLRKRIKYDIENKIRALTMKKCNGLDSSDSEENKNAKTNNISFPPNSNFLFIVDTLLIIFNLYSIIFIPLSIAKNENIFEKESTFKEIIKYLNDFIYLFDFLISLVRGYYNYEMKIIRDNKGILIHYLKQDFFSDLIEGIPICVLRRIFHNNKKKNYFLCF